MSEVPFRMAAIDLDGTLLGPDGRVGARNRAAITLMRERGIIPVLASGRMHASTLPTHRELDLDTPIVSYNGSMVVDPVSDQTLFHRTLDADLAKELVRWAERENLHLNYYLNDRLYVDHEDKWSRLYHERTGSIIEPVGSLTRFDGESPTKIILVAEPHETLYWKEQWEGPLKGRAYLVRTMVEYLEFLNPTVDKWSGVRAVAERYGVADEDVAAFGDSPNDLPMLVGAGTGVVMPYASADIREVADVVGEGGPEDAFGITVERMLST